MLEKLYNVNLKAMVPLVGNLSANAYLGASRAKMLSTATNYKSNNAWDNGISYGAGLEYNFLSDVSVHLNYMQYFKNLNGLEFGVGFQF
jgi:opacity protein-like surface antigen